MSSLTVQNIQGSASSSNTINIASGHKISGAAGSIVAPGQVIQTVSGETATEVNTTSTSFVDTNLTATITPKFASSKIAIWVNQSVYIYRSNYSPQDGIMAGIRLMRDSTVLNQGYSDGNGGLQPYLTVGGATNTYFGFWHNMNFVDSPNTTSATVYKTQGELRNNSNQTIRFQIASSTTNKSTIILQEIAQ